MLIVIFLMAKEQDGTFKERLSDIFGDLCTPSCG